MVESQEISISSKWHCFQRRPQTDPGNKNVQLGRASRAWSLHQGNGHVDEGFFSRIPMEEQSGGKYADYSPLVDFAKTHGLTLLGRLNSPRPDPDCCRPRHPGSGLWFRRSGWRRRSRQQTVPCRLAGMTLFSYTSHLIAYNSSVTFFYNWRDILIGYLMSHGLVKILYYQVSML